MLKLAFLPLILIALGGSGSSEDGEEEFCPDTIFVDPNDGRHYPDDSCTGVPDGVTLTAYTGPSTITTNDTVIDSKDITSCIFVTSATGVVIKNSRITVNSSSCWEGQAVAVHGTGSLTIQDSEINCGGDPPNGYNNSHGLGDENFTAIRLNIYGCENGLSAAGSNWSIVDSYIHDLRQCTQAEGCGDPDGAHTDGIQMPGGASDYVIRRNTILSMKAGASTPETDESYYTTSAIITDPSDSDALIEDNLWAGGAFTVYCPEDGENWVFQNNKFSTRYKSTVGFFGPTDSCSGVGTGNVYFETGDPVSL